MQNFLAIALGAAIGANVRYALGLWAAAQFGTAWPYGTFLINVLGCFAIGALLTYTAARQPLNEALRLLLVTGLLGGFTTFSTFGYESYTLLTTGNWLGASVYIAASVGGGLLAVVLGVLLMRSLLT